MSSNRTNLTLDEQFFQELLAAAYTIQQHNDSLDQVEPLQATPEAIPETQPESVCPQCGGHKQSEESPCQNCGSDAFRPGERMQRKWASMWLMSQEQGLWPERAEGSAETTHTDGPAFAVKRGTQTADTRDLAASGIVAGSLGNQLAQEEIAFDQRDAAADLQLGDVQNRDLRSDDLLNGDRQNGSGQHRDRRNGNQNGVSLADRLPDNSASSHSAVATQPPSNWIMDAPEGTSNHVLGDDSNRKESTKDSIEPAIGHFSLADTGVTDPHATDVHFSDTRATHATDADAADLDSAFAALTGDAAGEESIDPTATEMGGLDPAAEPGSLRQQIAHWQVKLRFHRADLYLGVAVFVAAVALLWPTAGSPQQTSLSPWQRALVTLGIAEAPPPAVHLQGDPTVEVWIDTHSALYYCPGEEQYGKTADGRFTSQREAQTDRFEPAGRLACE